MADITKIDTFIQASPYPAWLATAHGQCVYANPALERLTGFNSDQIAQSDWRSFLLEEDRAFASDSWQKSYILELPIARRSACEGAMTFPNASNSSLSATQLATVRNCGCLQG